MKVFLFLNTIKKNFSILFLILVGLIVTVVSEKNADFKNVHGVMSNSIKKSWKDSSQ